MNAVGEARAVVADVGAAAARIAAVADPSTAAATAATSTTTTTTSSSSRENDKEQVSVHRRARVKTMREEVLWLSGVPLLL